MGNTVVLGVLK